MYASMCVQTHVCIWVCDTCTVGMTRFEDRMYVYMYVCMYVCMYVWAHMYVFVCV